MKGLYVAKYRQLREASPLARTPSNCTVCGLPIAVGSRYTKIVYIDHEELNSKRKLKTVKWHLPTCPPGGREHG